MYKGHDYLSCCKLFLFLVPNSKWQNEREGIRNLQQIEWQRKGVREHQIIVFLFWNKKKNDVNIKNKKYIEEKR